MIYGDTAVSRKENPGIHFAESEGAIRLFYNYEGYFRSAFYLGNRFQEIYLWQEVADRDMDVSRIENLLYRCSFHDDEVAMAEVDESFMSKK